MRPVVRADAAPPGVIETLTGGFQAVNRVPWVIGLPVALDVLLWLGPRLSVAQISERALTALTRLIESLAPAAGPAASDQIAQFQQQIELLRGGSQAFNLLSLIAFGGFAMRSAVPADKSGLAGSIEVGTLSGLVGMVVILILVGIALACIWLGFLAQQIREGQVDVLRLLRGVPRYWLAIVGFLMLVTAVLVGIAVPLSALAAIAQVMAPAVGAFLAVFAAITFQLLFVWCVLYLFFFSDAIVVSEVGPVRAALNSIRVVSTHFWTALGFIIITWVIMSGMGIIWSSLSRAPVGIVVAILGNGYIESGLAAASMLFYQNRVARLAESTPAT